MSGGVDSAVALLRARPARGRRHAAAVARSGRARRGARLLLPGGGDRGTRDVPSAGPSARDARPARGVPSRGRRRRSPRGYARGETPNPCIRCNGGFRFAELLAFASRAGCDAARHRPLRAGRRASWPALAAPRRRREQGSVVHARAPRPEAARARLVPARRSGQGDDARRGGACRSRRRGARRESGGVLPRG